MKACTLTFSMRTGTGTQTVTGVHDKNGNPFIGEAFLFHGHGTLNTLMNGDGGFRDAFMIANGVDDGNGTRFSEASSDAAGFGFKVVDGASSAQYSLLAVHSQLSFGGAIVLEAYISAVASGSFTLTYDLNNTSASNIYPFFVAGQSFIVTVLADLDTQIGTPTGGGLPTSLSLTPVGIYYKYQQLNSGTATGAGGGGACAYGWATRDSDRSCAATFNVLQAGQGRYQSLTPSANTLTSSLTVDASDTNAFGVMSFTQSGQVARAYHAVGGSGIVTKAGSFIQPVSTGQQEVTTGILNRIVFVQGASMTHAQDSTVVTASPSLSHCFGVMDGTRGNSYWCGEVGNNPASPLGARYLSDATVLRFGTANGGSTTFGNTAAFVEFDDVAGSFTVDWTAVDGTQREILWYAIGEDITPVPPPTGTERVVRCVRRFPLPFEENKQLFLSRIEFICQMGVGLSTGQGSDPQIMMRISRDGGSTWGNEIWMSLGKIGEYFRRAYANRLGRGRNLMVEVVCTDPVFLGLIECSIDIAKGTS